MDMMSLIVGALISIPLSIVANLLTPKFQTWRAKRSESAASKRAEKDRGFRARIEFYESDAIAYRAFVHQSVIRTIGDNAMALGQIILCGFLAYITNEIGDDAFGYLGFSAAFLLLISGLLLMVYAQRNASEAYGVARSLEIRRLVLAVKVLKAKALDDSGEMEVGEVVTTSDSGSA